MTNRLKLGMIGLDTSHVTAFAELLHDATHPFHVEGGEVVAAFPGGSPDFELSRSRVGGFTEALRDQYGVAIVDDVSTVAERCDAVFLESVDGRVHLKQFEQIVRFGKPIFVDKPFALQARDAAFMVRLAAQYHVPVMSCSALRFCDSLTASLAQSPDVPVFGVDAFGPMAIEATQPGLFWYGIHTVEVLFAVLGQGCRRVTTVTSSHHDTIVGEWADGRIGTIRGNRKGNYQFSCVVHRENQSEFIDISGCKKPFYASLLENIMNLFTTCKSPVDIEETLEIIRFIEAANRSRETGQPVDIDQTLAI